MLGRRIDLRSPADLERILPDQTPADERCPGMAAAIAAMAQGMMNDFGRHRIMNVSAMAAAGGARRRCHDERSEERCVGKESVSTCRSRWSPYHYTTNNITNTNSLTNNIKLANKKHK